MYVTTLKNVMGVMGREKNQSVGRLVGQTGRLDMAIMGSIFQDNILYTVVRTVCFVLQSLFALF
jgi:hypothetical protein